MGQMAKRNQATVTQREEARGSLHKLKGGLAVWITANKQRTETLDCTADRCEIISNQKSEQCSLLTEAQVAQNKNAQSVTQVGRQVEDQGKKLNELSGLIGDINDRTDKLKEYSYFAPPDFIWSCLIWIFVFVAIFTITAWVIRHGFDVDHIRKS